ncbi:MAG: hypothetical protein ACU0DT_15635 [Albimonas sp.]|uniref:hypothetical protein n=1 Tax=Albimonas sp. TaxID=1872425 RepID=UPI0040575E7E
MGAPDAPAGPVLRALSGPAARVALPVLLALGLALPGGFPGAEISVAIAYGDSLRTEGVGGVAAAAVHVLLATWTSLGLGLFAGVIVAGRGGVRSRVAVLAFAVGLVTLQLAALAWLLLAMP